MTFNEIRSNQSLTLLCSDGELTKSVVTFGVVMGDNSTMIHVGYFIKYHDQSSVAAQVVMTHGKIFLEFHF